MIVWYDTEFIEQGPALPIQLISIGMVREDGATLYLINADVSLSTLVRHPWLSMNVVPQLPIKVSGMHSGMLNGIIEWEHDHPDYKYVMAADSIAEVVRDFAAPRTRDELGEITKVEPAELWAYYGAYDHVVLSQLFGSMADLPAGMPMYTNDIMQEWTRIGRPAILPPDPEHAHNALDDALWCKQAWDELHLFQRFIWASDGMSWPVGETDDRFKEWKERQSAKVHRDVDGLRGEESSDQDV